MSKDSEHPMTRLSDIPGTVGYDIYKPASYAYQAALDSKDMHLSAWKLNSKFESKVKRRIKDKKGKTTKIIFKDGSEITFKEMPYSGFKVVHNPKTVAML